MLTELQLPRSATFEATQAAVAAIGSPLLLAPSRIFYDGAQPALTFVVQDYTAWHAPGSSSLADWVAQARGRVEALTEGPTAPLGRPTPPPLLAAKLSPLFTAVSLLHRLGLLHGAVAPEAARLHPDGSMALGCAGFTTGGTMGAYDAPEVFHDATAHEAAPLAADAWSLGAVRRLHDGYMTVT